MSDNSIADYVFDNSFVFSNKSVNSKGPKVNGEQPRILKKELWGTIKKNTNIEILEVWYPPYGNHFIAFCPLREYSQFRCDVSVSTLNRDGAITTIRRHIRDTHMVR